MATPRAHVASDLVLRATELSKRFRLGPRAPYKTLRESLMSALPVGLGGRPRIPREELWALLDVSFEVRPGELVGVIGRNGAGKSTLLKVLSRITEPTAGRIEIWGRVGSLLEVGTGFHPELTGRENVYLNGAILGMRRAEITRRFDEIVAFAQVERFLDTAVKYYSTGMYLRLAFSVAAHLEPDILLVDEVLAVGDASFQRKCLGKMQEVGESGRTVLFVSHNMPAVTRLCSRTLLLEHGRVVADGPSPEVVSAYLRSGFGTQARREWPDPQKAPGDAVARLRVVRVTGMDGRVSDVVDIREPVGVEMTYEVLAAGSILVPNIHVFDLEGVCVFVSADVGPEWRGRERPAGDYTSTAWIPGNLLAEGTLVVGAAVSTMDPVVVHFFERDAVAFQVVDRGDGDSARGDYAGSIPGVVRPLLRWTTTYTPET